MSFKRYMASVISQVKAYLRPQLAGIYPNEERHESGKASWPLSYHLIILTLVIIVPLLALAALSMRNSIDAEWETAHQNAQRIADEAISRFDRELVGAITLLNVLARDTSFDRREYHLLYDRAKEGMVDRKGKIELISTDGRVVFSTAAEFGADLPRTTSANLPSAATLMQPFVTDLFAEKSTDQPRFEVVVPIMRRRQAIAALHLSIEPAELSALTNDSVLPPHWQFVLSDRQGKTVATSAALARVGEPMPASMLAGAHESAGSFEVSADGQSWLTAYRRSQVTGWLGYALIPLSSIQTPFVLMWQHFLTTGLSFLAMSVIAAYLLSLRMTRPIDSLTRAAIALGRGERFLMPHSSLREANVLGEAIGQAALELRHHSEALSESERRFRMFAEQSADMIWFLDTKKNRIDYMSPAFERIWGRPMSEVSSTQDWRRTLFADDLAILDQIMAHPVTRSVQTEYRIVRPDGALRWVRDTRFPLAEAARPARIIAGIVRDFTERREAIDNMTAARTEAESRLAELEDLYKSSPIGLAVVGRDYRLQRINDFIANIKGRSREQCVGLPLFELLPEIEAVGEPLFSQILAGGEAVTGAQFHTESAGGGTAIYWAAHFYPITAGGGGVSGIGIILEDITEETIHQNALGRLADIVYAANDAMFSTSASGMIMNWNPAAESLFQFTPDEASGKAFSSLFPEGEDGAYQTLLDEVRKGESARLETKLCRKDETTVPVSISVAPIKGGDAAYAVSVTIEDITERKRFEERQLLMNRELAHRVKNSLAVIQAMARHTLRSSASPEAFAKAFEGRLQAMSTSHNLLTASQWEGAVLGELIREQLAPYLVGADRLRLSGPSVQLPPGIATSLGLVLHELSTNAQKYGALSTPSGKIDIGWTITGAGNDRLLHLIWQESGGPLVSEPREKGFGSTLMDYSGKVTQWFEPEGLRCSIEMAFSDALPRAY